MPLRNALLLFAFFLNLIFTAPPLFSTLQNTTHENTTLVYDYVCPADLSTEIWEKVKPYFLPSNHLLKPKLDRIFSKNHVTSTSRTLRKAGFLRPTPRPFSGAVVSKHPKLKGYYVKMYTDANPSPLPDWQQWLNRLEGAKAIKEAIKKHGYHSLFKVPKKWIYPLPAQFNRQHFILIAEELPVLTIDKNNYQWKSSAMTKKRAAALFTIILENGLIDSIYPFNIPFCSNGKQAFIDTEHHHKAPIHFDQTLKYFSSSLATYWLELMHQHGYN